jgi:L-threonylcarbamoyladenylate synthase
VIDSLGESVDFVLDGGPCAVGVESTIVSLETDPPTLLRPGGTPRESIEATLGMALCDRAPRDEWPAAPDSPGQLSSHYAPRTPLTLLPLGTRAATPSTRASRVGALVFHQAPSSGFAVVECLAPDGRETTAAARLFAALRRLDTAGLDLILAESCPETGLGRAIMDRLRRASASRPRT